MANCISCGRALPSFSLGRGYDACADCRGRISDQTALTRQGVASPQVRARTGAYAMRLSVTTVLVGLNIGVFLIMVLSGVSVLEPTTQQLLKWGANFGPLSLGSQPWRLLASNYLHIGIIHIFLNMWCLLNLGALAERIFDRWTYVLVYTAAGVSGSLSSLWWHPMVIGAGASGAIFGLAGALIAALYLGKLPIPREAVKSTMKSLLSFAAYNLFFGMAGGIDNAAHIGGLVIGLALGAFFSGHLRDAAEERARWRSYALAGVMILCALAFRELHKLYPALPSRIDR